MTILALQLKAKKKSKAKNLDLLAMLWKHKTETQIILQWMETVKLLADLKEENPGRDVVPYMCGDQLRMDN